MKRLLTALATLHVLALPISYFLAEYIISTTVGGLSRQAIAVIGSQVWLLGLSLLGLFTHFTIFPVIENLKQRFRDKERIRLTQLLQAGAISADEFDKRMSRLSS